jgi:indolepyruvate decarboxylase
MINPESVDIRYHRYNDLAMTHVVTALLERLPQSERSAPQFASPAADLCPAVASDPQRLAAPADSGSAETAVIRIADIIAALRSLDQSRFSFVTDVGDSWFIGLELRVDVFIAAGHYSSMGFGVPAALGAGIAEPDRRPLVIVGDGAFQMTGTELATLIDQGLRPIVLLLNNRGYGMLEAVDRPRRYYERRNWDDPAVARALGAQAERVSSADELCAALRRAEAAPIAYLIEAQTAKDDLSPTMARLKRQITSAWRVPVAL